MKHRSRGWLLLVIPVLAISGVVFALRSGSVPATGSEHSYAFLGMFQDQPITWDACTPITWMLNPGEASDAVVADISEAVAEISRASGFEFTFAGLTDQSFPAGMRAEVPDAHLHMEIVANNDSAVLVPSEWAKTDLKHEKGRLLGAVIAFDEAYTPVLSTGPGPNTWRALAQHELGHVLGLDHTDDPRDAMHTWWNATEGVLSRGDLAGMKVLRAQSDC